VKKAVQDVTRMCIYNLPHNLSLLLSLIIMSFMLQCTVYKYAMWTDSEISCGWLRSCGLEAEHMVLVWGLCHEKLNTFASDSQFRLQSCT